MRAVIAVVLGLVAVSSAHPRGDNVVIAGGTFRMGTEQGAIAGLRSKFQVSFRGSFENEVPAHEVTVSTFQIDRFEVTNRHFAEFVAARPEWGTGRPGADPDLPVVFVTWNAAQSYCRWKGGRLPTEAEWEYAARARDNREFPWGEGKPTPALANYGASGMDAPVGVGRYAPNPAGLYDMAGNVWEWVLDSWEPTYFSRGVDPIAGGPVPDSAIGAITGRRVIRGGSYGGAAVNLRTRWRDSHEAANAKEFVGFRCALPTTAIAP